MSRSERLREIIKTNGLTQRKFAESLKITESYVSMLLKDNEINISHQLLELIERSYGYNSKWVAEGCEPKFSRYSKDTTLPEVNRRLISMIEGLSPKQSSAVLAFINSLEEVEECLKDSEHNEEAATLPIYELSDKDKEEAKKLAEMAVKNLIGEKTQESQTSSVKESDGVYNLGISLNQKGIAKRGC